MRILIPHMVKDGFELGSKFVFGGAEIFAEKIYDNFDSRIVYFTRDDNKSRRAFTIIRNAVLDYKPDVILINYHTRSLTVKLQEMFNVPVIWLEHVLPGHIGALTIVEYMHEFMSVGGTLAGVSRKQEYEWSELSKRILNKPLKFNGGSVNPAYSFTDIPYSTDIYSHDIVTIGRCSTEKDPFFAHKIGKKTNRSSLVITSFHENEFAKNENNKEYYDNNQKWERPQDTIYDLEHKKILETVKKCGIFLSTCSKESFGIAALEALTQGVPCLLCADSSKTHSSEFIVPKSLDATITIPKGSNIKIYTEAIEYLLNKTKQERADISNTTIELNSLTSWKRNLLDLFRLAKINYNQIELDSPFNNFYGE